MILQVGPFGLTGVQIEYYKRGLQRPIDGDMAMVDVHISLPCAPGKDELADDFIFGESIGILGSPLTAQWGSVIAKGKRTMIFTAFGKTYAEAFEGAENDIEDLLKPLVTAYRARKELQKKADWGT